MTHATTQIGIPCVTFSHFGKTMLAEYTQSGKTSKVLAPETNKRFSAHIQPLILLALVFSLISQVVKAEDLPHGLDSTLPVFSSSRAVSASPQRTLAALTDIAAMPSWLPLTKKASRLPDSSSAVTWLHVYMGGLPNEALQDVVLALHVEQAKDRKSIIIYGSADPAHLPVETGIVRIQQLNICWTLTAQYPHGTDIRMQVQIVPPFNIPPFLYGVVAMVPQRALLNLQQRIIDPRYHDAHAVLMQGYKDGFFERLQW